MSLIEDLLAPIHILAGLVIIFIYLFLAAVFVYMLVDLILCVFTGKVLLSAGGPPLI